jgi:hypothetical protein
MAYMNWRRVWRGGFRDGVLDLMILWYVCQEIPKTIYTELILMFVFHARNWRSCRLHFQTHSNFRRDSEEFVAVDKRPHFVTCAAVRCSLATYGSHRTSTLERPRHLIINQIRIGHRISVHFFDAKSRNLRFLYLICQGCEANELSADICPSAIWIPAHRRLR